MGFCSHSVIIRLSVHRVCGLFCTPSLNGVVYDQFFAVAVVACAVPRAAVLVWVRVCVCVHVCVRVRVCV